MYPVIRPMLIGSKTCKLCRRVALLAKRIGESNGMQVSMQAVAPYERAMRNKERSVRASTGYPFHHLSIFVRFLNDSLEEERMVMGPYLKFITPS